MIYDQIENAHTYFRSEVWDRAFEFLRTVTADIADGAHPLLGDEVVARVMSYETKHFQETVLESHEKHVDIQVLLAGQEFAEVSHASELVVRTPYAPENDVVFYSSDPQVSYCRMTLEPGRFAVFFPQDAHRTQLRVGSAAEAVKKVVIKIEKGLLLPKH